jgi:hypothetical protein
MLKTAFFHRIWSKTYVIHSHVASRRSQCNERVNVFWTMNLILFVSGKFKRNYFVCDSFSKIFFQYIVHQLYIPDEVRARSRSSSSLHLTSTDILYLIASESVLPWSYFALVFSNEDFGRIFEYVPHGPKSLSFLRNP